MATKLLLQSGFGVALYTNWAQHGVFGDNPQVNACAQDIWAWWDVAALGHGCGRVLGTLGWWDMRVSGAG
ncbi:MAG: hypothetical protein Q4A92_05530 [Corynebacterium sp.]|nr:hypothetical protein [Corynebacterium sp.]